MALETRDMDDTSGAIEIGAIEIGARTSRIPDTASHGDLTCPASDEG